MLRSAKWESGIEQSAVPINDSAHPAASPAQFLRSRPTTTLAVSWTNYQGNVTLLDRASGSTLGVVEPGGSIAAVALDQAGTRLACLLFESPEIAVIDLDSKEKTKLNCPKHHVAAFSPTGNELAIGTTDGHLVLLDVAGGRTLESTVGQIGRTKSPAYCGLAYSPDGETIAAVSVDGFIHIQDTGSWQRTNSIDLGRRLHAPFPGASLAFSDDSRHLLAFNANATVYIFRLARQAR